MEALRSMIVVHPHLFIRIIMQFCIHCETEFDLHSFQKRQGLKYKRHAWAIHNLIGHPLMQIFSWLHLTEVGLKIHDATVPNPTLLL
jgi:hypothetical protein